MLGRRAVVRRRGLGPTARRHRGRRLAAGAVAALALLLLAARLALTPLVEAQLRRSLARMKGMRGTFSGLELSVLHLSGTLHDLRIEKPSPEGRRTPYVQVKRAELGLHWKALLHGHVVGAAEIDNPKISLVSSPREREAQGVKEAPELAKKLEAMQPFLLDRFEVKGGEVLWIDAQVPERPRLWLHDVAATVENFATRAALSRGEPSVLAASGTLQRSGRVSLFASADPLAKGLTFAGQARLEGLQLAELGELLAATAGITPRHGTLDVSTRFKADQGHLTGGVKPVLKDAAVQQARPGFGAKLKAFLADLALDVLSDRVPGRNAVATSIPIEGEIQDPNAQLWPTVIGVVRNAFVAALSDSLANLPPHGAGGGEQRQPPEQARRAPGARRAQGGR